MKTGFPAGYLRLLPAVLAAGTGLLALKGIGMVREARADEKPAQLAAARLDDNPVAAQDFASDDRETGSAAEIDVLTSLAKRRAELDARARDQAMRENILAASEKRVDAKIAALKALQTQMTALLGQRDAAQEAQVKSLVKTYTSMKPKDAARIFDGLDQDVLITVAQAMKSDALAPVLAAMNPAAAQKLTVKLASRLNLPDTVAAQAPASPPPASMPTAESAGALPQAAETPPSTAAPPPAQPQAAAPQADPAAKHG